MGVDTSDQRSQERIRLADLSPDNRCQWQRFNSKRLSDKTNVA